MTPRLDSISAVCVVDEDCPSLETFQALGAMLATLAQDSEIIVIANGVSAEVTQRLRAIAEVTPDLTEHFLAKTVDRDLATLIGLDQCLGDYQIVLTPTIDEIAALPQALGATGQHEIVFAGALDASEVPSLYRSLASLYFRLCGRVSGITIDWPAPAIRIYSRAAARYLVAQMDGEFLIRSIDFSGAFPGTRLDIANLQSADFRLPTAGRALLKGARGFLNTSAVLLRAVITVSTAAGVFALLSSVYAVLVYFLKEDVAPGWTTLSLQISAMMFLFSLLLGLMGEYVLNVYRATPPRRRIAIVREYRSPLRRHAGRVNVIGRDAVARLGAPPSVPAIVPYRQD